MATLAKCSTCGGPRGPYAGRSACQGCQAAKNAKRHATNRDQENASMREWNEGNRNLRRASRNNWYLRNRAHVIAKVNGREAAKLAQCPDRHDPRVVAVYQIADWLRQRGDAVHVDHILPLSKGGLHAYPNLRVLSAVENATKHDRMPNAAELEVCRTLQESCQ